jgi:hypothetical protein
VEFEALCARALMTTDKHLAIQKAQRRGTLHKDDRSRQYTAEELDKEELVDQLNLAWTEIRRLKRQVSRYRVVNTVLISIITGVAWEGVKALVPWVIAAHAH